MKLSLCVYVCMCAFLNLNSYEMRGPHILPLIPHPLYCLHKVFHGEKYFNLFLGLTPDCAASFMST